MKIAKEILWTTNQAYSIGSIVTYGGSSYRCLQAHTSIAGWTPDIVPALWEKNQLKIIKA